MTTVNVPAPVTNTAATNGVTAQAGWTYFVPNPLYTSRPTTHVQQDNVAGVYTVHGAGLSNSNSTTVITSGTNYISGTNTGIIISTSGGAATHQVGVHYGSSMIFTNFGGGNSGTSSITGTLYIAITTNSTRTTAGPQGVVGVGEVDIQYMADSMKDWVTIATGIGADGELIAATPVAVNLTIQNINTLQVKIVLTAQPYYTYIESLYYPSSSATFTDNFNLYDMVFVGGTTYPLNAPDGSSTGTALVEDGSQGYHGASSDYTSIAGQFSTFSLYTIPGDLTRNIMLKLGSGSNLVAQAVFNPNAGTVVGSAIGNSASASVTGFSSAVPSTGVILVNTLMVNSTAGQIAQIAPNILQLPTNGNVITYSWSFSAATTGTTITSATNGSQITFTSGSAGNCLLQCLITVNGVQTIYTQYITIVASTMIYRISITGKEYISGTNTVSVNLVNTWYNLTYNDPATTWDVGVLPSGIVDGEYWPIYQTTPWNTQGPLTYTTIAPSVAQANSTVVAMNGYYQAGWNCSWSISNTAGGASITSGGSTCTCTFNPGNVGVCTITCTVSGSVNMVSSAVIQVISTLQLYYPGIAGSGWAGIWGAQVESYGVSTPPTPLILTSGTPLTDLYVLNAATGNIVFGVPPLEDAVLSASYNIFAVSTVPIEYYWTGQYNEALPNYIPIGVNPQLNLASSVDGGHTFSTPVSMPIGTSGSFMNRCIWRRLGQSRDRVFKITCSDPVKLTLIGHDLTTRFGNE